jgi:hypothetical protein
MRSADMETQDGYFDIPAPWLAVVSCGEFGEDTTTVVTPGYTECTECDGSGYELDEGSAPDPSVGWYGQDEEPIECSCDKGYVPCDVPPPHGEPVREVAA